MQLLNQTKQGNSERLRLFSNLAIPMIFMVKCAFIFNAQCNLRQTAVSHQNHAFLLAVSFHHRL